MAGAVDAAALRAVFPRVPFGATLIEKHKSDGAGSAASNALVLFRLNAAPRPKRSEEDVKPVAFVEKAEESLRVLGVARQLTVLEVYDSRQVLLDAVPVALRPRLENPADLADLLAELNAGRKARLFLVVLSDYLPLTDVVLHQGWSLAKKTGWGVGRIPGIAAAHDDHDVAAQRPWKRIRTKTPQQQRSCSPRQPLKGRRPEEDKAQRSFKRIASAG